MSDCSGEDCNHPSHNQGMPRGSSPSKAIVDEAMHEVELPNEHRIPIPKVQKGIDLIAGRKYPIIICECGSADQRKFVRYIATEFIEDKERPHRKRKINRSHVMCIAEINGKKCGVSIPKIEFDMKAAKLVEESKRKAEPEKAPVEKEPTTEKPEEAKNN